MPILIIMLIVLMNPQWGVHIPWWIWSLTTFSVFSQAYGRQQADKLYHRAVEALERMRD